MWEGMREQEDREPPIVYSCPWEVQAKHVSVTLRWRAHFAARLHRLRHAAVPCKDGPRMDRRNQRTWRQVLMGVLVQRSTRLLALGRFVAPQRRANSVKAAAH